MIDAKLVSLILVTFTGIAFWMSMEGLTTDGLMEEGVSLYDACKESDLQEADCEYLQKHDLDWLSEIPCGVDVADDVPGFVTPKGIIDAMLESDYSKVGPTEAEARAAGPPEGSNQREGPEPDCHPGNPDCPEPPPDCYPDCPEDLDEGVDEYGLEGSGGGRRLNARQLTDRHKHLLGYSDEDEVIFDGRRLDELEEGEAEMELRILEQPYSSYIIDQCGHPSRRRRLTDRKPEELLTEMATEGFYINHPVDGRRLAVTHPHIPGRKLGFCQWLSDLVNYQPCSVGLAVGKIPGCGGVSDGANCPGYFMPDQGRCPWRNFGYNVWMDPKKWTKRACFAHDSCLQGKTESRATINKPSQCGNGPRRWFESQHRFRWGDRNHHDPSYNFGWNCDAHLASVSFRSSYTPWYPRCSGCTGCSWRGCSGCSGCYGSGNTEGFWIPLIIGLSMQIKPNTDMCSASRYD